MTENAIRRAPGASTTSMRAAHLISMLGAFMLFVSGCEPVQTVVATPETMSAPVDNTAIAPKQTNVATAMSMSPLATLPSIVAPFASDANVSPGPEEAAVASLVSPMVSPVRMVIPSALMDVSVQPMGWESIRVDGVRTTRWLLPEGAAGWHVDSARPGATGNVILSGRQLGGDVFAPIAQDALQVGKEILLFDSAGNEFRYRIVEVSEPLPLQGSADADASIAAFLAQADTPTLTLLTGWPDFTTTHRVVVVAKLEP